ncbi:MAG: Gfo/Idh/MocA family oxidoreductase [bacterium]|nr:Gfo/Idh/MocA family oxidoreductase [bacterium]
MSERKLGVLIHGAGWVSTQHIGAFTANPNTEIVAISSLTKENARSRADESGLDVACYDDYQEALSHEGVDIVSVCTPQHLHAENTIAAAGAGKHVAIEKPAAMTIEEIRAMRDAIATAGVKTIVSFVLRWNPMFQSCKSLIDSGELGEIYSVETDYQSYLGDWWGGYEQGRSISTGRSAMLVAGCHAIDALRWFAAPGEFEAARPVEVFAYAGGKRKGTTRQYNPTTGQWHEGAPLEYDGLEIILVQFSNGVLGKVSVNFECIQPYKLPIRVFGDAGTICDNRIYSPSGTEQSDWKEIPGIRPDSSDVSHHPFQAQMDHFVECIINDVESHCNFEDAAITHEIALAAQECYQTGQPVKLPIL